MSDSTLFLVRIYLYYRPLPFARLTPNGSDLSFTYRFLFYQILSWFIFKTTKIFK